jgi:hypothetical protein
MVTKKTKIIFAVAVLTTAFIAVAATDFYLITPQLASKPFVFNLSTYPNNGTSMQAQNLTIRVDVVYLEGMPEPVTLSVSGGPNGIIYQFSNQTGIPTAKQPFSSNLTLCVPASAAFGSYLINVSSTAGAKVCQATFDLTVVYAEIQVSGTVTVVSRINIDGTILDVIPTDILFKSNTTDQTYQVKVHRFTDTNLAPGKTGSYYISLPNQQSYSVTFYCFSFPHYIPVLRVASGGTENGYLAVDCKVDAVVANFIG